MASSDDDRIAYLAGEPGRFAHRPRSAPSSTSCASCSQAPATWAAARRRLSRTGSSRRSPRRLGTSPRAPRARRPALAPSSAQSAVARLRARRVRRGGGRGSRRRGRREQHAPAPQQFAMVVSGTAPRARRARLGDAHQDDSGWRIELSAAGLPRLANGRYYQAWLKNAAGVLVPVGTFNDARQVTLWAGVPPDGISGAHGHPPAGQRQPGLIRRTRARRDHPREPLSGPARRIAPVG